MKIIEGGVTKAKGFYASGVEAGIKYKNRKDMALVYSIVPAKTAGVYTQNVVKAAPVKWDQMLTQTKETARAIVLNSGIANACTGKEGEQCNLLMAKSVAEACDIQVDEVLTASTGVIGMQLNLEAIKKGAVLLKQNLADTMDAGHLAAEAIMTTDTISKECAVEFEIEDKLVTIGGMSKGSGMIHPNMATMLSVITTDAVISKQLLQKALSADVKNSFNMISVDRDTSTNDTLLILANGLAENEEIQEGTKEYQLFCDALACVTTTLAKMMAGDGEGATKLFEVIVKNATTMEKAAVLAKYEINWMLFFFFKCRNCSVLGNI